MCIKTFNKCSYVYNKYAVIYLYVVAGALLYNRNSSALKINLNRIRIIQISKLDIYLLLVYLYNFNFYDTYYINNVQ